MDGSTWAIDGGDDSVQEIQGRKFSTGDSGSPMLCSIICKELGRHAHVDFCRAKGQPCKDFTVEHIRTPMGPEPSRPKDWVTHSLYWARASKRSLSRFLAWSYSFRLQVLKVQ